MIGPGIQRVVGRCLGRSHKPPQPGSIPGPATMTRLTILSWLLLAAPCLAQLQGNTVAAVPYEINELRAELHPPDGDGWSVLSQLWLPASQISGNPYNNNEVFVFTGRPGDQHVISWVVTFARLDGQSIQSHTETRRWLIRFEGEPPAPPKPDPPKPDPPDPTDTVTRATYVYEREDQTVPRPIHAALAKLNQSGIQATAIDQDARDGTGEIPSQYARALAAAKQAGLPCLVVERGDSVQAIKNPTAEQILELQP